jgi:hypothetical protein
MSGKLDYERARRKERQRARRRKKKARTITVHPNSTAARKWGRSSWRTTSG